MLSVIVPSRNELFMAQTVDDLFVKAKGDIEVIVVLEGYWPNGDSTGNLPDESKLKHGQHLTIIHHTKAKGLRGATNAAARIAKGKYLMKIDAHCLFAEGFDEVLKADCEPDWVVAPRRYSLDPENWCRRQKHPIDYLYCDPPSEDNNWEINVRVWNEKNYDKELQEKLIDDIFTFQGSCWFMHREYFYQLELMDDINYGTFRKEPQEITFKAWLSGGRVVRNKKTWYAHLHKGRQYGRGYSTSRKDFKKGDQYLTFWLSDSAWDKQTIPFRWMIDKFDMPGWEGFDWRAWYLTEEKKDKPVDKIEDKKVVKLYQNIPMAGVAPQNADKNNSRFWNEGKWDNFIKLQLSMTPEDMTFVEMGANAGLFLKLAEDHGFRNVVGIEKDKTPVREGLRYRDQIGYNYKLLKRTLGGRFGENGTFDIDELPIADYTLMSTFHYYIDINSWMKYVDRLKSKSCHVLFVSRPKVKRMHWRAQSSIKDLRGYFADWEEISLIDNVPTEGDPSPRNLFSVMFKSPVIERMDLKDIVLRESKDDSMYVAMKVFAERIVADDTTDPFETDYYAKWVERKAGRWSDRFIKRFVHNKYKMLMDIKANGPKDPLILDKENRLSDGGHRLVVLEALDYKSVIVRRV